MADNKNKNQGPQVRQAELTILEQYLYANLLWWGFLDVLAIVSFFTCDGSVNGPNAAAQITIGFLFVVLIGFVAGKLLGSSMGALIAQGWIVIGVFLVIKFDLLDDVTAGVMEFIFVILGGGFILVTLLDYLYEKYVARSLSEGKS